MFLDNRPSHVAKWRQPPASHPQMWFRVLCWDPSAIPSSSSALMGNAGTTQHANTHLSHPQPSWAFYTCRKSFWCQQNLSSLNMPLFYHTRDKRRNIKLRCLRARCQRNVFLLRHDFPQHTTTSFSLPVARISPNSPWLTQTQCNQVSAISPREAVPCIKLILWPIAIWE